MAQIKGFQLVLLTISVSLGIFMNVLDTAIANVAIPTIAGDVGVSANEGTWVITSFAVSLAIVLPLTGWLASRFGEVKLYVVCTILFSITSVLCGLSNSLPMLIVCRVLQGLVAGPMIPLSQSLLLANYPESKKGLATSLWSMVAVAAPVLGPIMGGYITDIYSWPWIFYINLPVGVFSAYFTWKILSKRDTPTVKKPIDYVGLILLATGIACLQILLDKGKDLDWFHSTFIITLTFISTLCLSAFVIWELTEKHPIVDLSLFKIRNFTVGTAAVSLGYMCFFGSVVILPLWLQTQMNYTATLAGLATAPIGILPLILSPLLGRVMHKIDLRMVVSFGFLTFAYCSFWIAHFNTDVTLGNVAFARFVQGIGIPCFFIPCLAILMSGLPKERLASAAGLSNFTRILAGSFGTSITVTFWDHREAVHQSNLVQNLMLYNPQMKDTLERLSGAGFSLKSSFAEIANEITNQSYMMATNDIFFGSGIIFIFLFTLIWLARPPFLAKAQAVGE